MLYGLVPGIKTTFRSHLTVLETSSSLFASSPAFRIPQADEETGNVEHWDIITYQKFYDDVQRVAKHWVNTLGSATISSPAVIGLWLSGWSYSDIVQIYGLSRAGYVPQLFSLKLPNPNVIFELLEKANAQALIYAKSFEDNLHNIPVPLYLPADTNDLCDIDCEPLPTLTSIIHGDDIALIFHTSGSTSGSPKLVPCSYTWLDNIVRKANQVGKPRDLSRTDVTTWMGSACHIGQTFMLIGSLQHGACTIQPTQIAFSSEELGDMIDRCGLNRLNQFATFLGMHLRNAWSNPKLLGHLQSLDEVLYSGLSLGKEEERWAYKNGISLKNLFGSTECGAMMLSIGGQNRNASHLRPLDGVFYAFCPVDPATPDPAATGAMLEMVILSKSGDCPHPSLRSSADGNFHTGDLFEEVTPGSYIFRGRDDDWIKSETGLRCDTKSIEDNVRSVCSDLIAECVVVGNGRPSPVIFVEPARNDIDPSQLKEELLEKTRDFHARRYLHERISSGDMIIVLDRGTLPRTATKGNIRRRAVEEAFKEKLDEVYRVV